MVLIRNQTYVNRCIYESAVFNRRASCLFSFKYCVQVAKLVVVVLKTALKADDSTERFNSNSYC